MTIENLLCIEHGNLCETRVPLRPDHITNCMEEMGFAHVDRIEISAVRVEGWKSTYLPARLKPLIIPADCEFCPPGECGDFEAVGYLPVTGSAICVRCLKRLNLESLLPETA